MNKKTCMIFKKKYENVCEHNGKCKYIGRLEAFLNVNVYKNLKNNDDCMIARIIVVPLGCLKTNYIQ